MDAQDLKALLAEVARGSIAPEVAVAKIGAATADLSFATLDLHRGFRVGVPEVVYAEGKTTEQVVAIGRRIHEASRRLLVTRTSSGQRDALAAEFKNLKINALARTVRLEPEPRELTGQVAIVSAGTSDLPVAEEAAETALALGTRVVRVVDVGVAGLHRLAPHLATLRSSNAIIVVAGMEGALPSVVAGLVDRPLVAVPTSVGYGAAFGGLTALLGMLTACAAGVTVVNIDNGFGAGYAAALINRGAGLGTIS